MSRLTLKHLIISSLVLLVAVGILGATGAAVRKKEALLQVQRTAVHKELQQEELLRKLQKMAEQSKDDRTALDSYFITQESDSITVLTLIESMAPKAGVHLETKGLQKVSDKDTKTDWIEINLDFSGRRTNVEHFIAILERLPYFSYITSVDLNEQAIDYWRALVTVRVYISNHDSK